MFPTIAMLNHACLGSLNAIYNWREYEQRLVVHAVRPIEKGEEIFIAYFDTKMPREERQ